MKGSSMKQQISACILSAVLGCFPMISNAEAFISEKNIQSAVVADFDHDGKTDIAILSDMPDSKQLKLLEIFYGNTGLTAKQPGQKIQLMSATSVNHTKIGKDHYLIVTARGQRVFILNSKDNFKTPWMNPSANQWRTRCEIGKISNGAENFTDIVHGSCLRRFTPPDQVQHGFVYGPQKFDTLYLKITDLNLDGTPDLVASVYRKAVLRLYYGPFAANHKIKPQDLSEYVELVTSGEISPGIEGHDFAIGDLNGDERPDIAAVSSKCDIFLQNSPTGFTNNAKPNYSIPQVGIPVIHNNSLYLVHRKNGKISVFRNADFSRPAEVIQTGLKNIKDFRVENEIFIIIGMRGNKSEIRWGKLEELMPAKPAATSAVVYPHYTGEIHPVPQQAKYGNNEIALKQVSIIPDGIKKDDLRIQFLQEHIQQLGGNSTVAPPHTSNTTEIRLELSDEKHPHAQAYYIKTDTANNRVILKAFDKTGLTWAVGSLLQMMTKTNGCPVVKEAEVYDYPISKRRGYWAGSFYDFKDISKKEWAKIHMLYKMDTLLLVRAWEVTDGKEKGSWKNWRELLSNSRIAGYKEMGELFSPLGIEWIITTHPITGSPENKINSASPEDYEIILKQAEAVISCGGSFMFQYDDTRYPRNPAETAKYPHGYTADYDFITRVTDALSKKYPDAKFYFCPPMYWGPRDNPNYPDKREDYLGHLQKLPQSIGFTWNGPTVCSTKISPQNVKWARKSYGRKPILLIFGGPSNIERYHFFTEAVPAWSQWYYSGMEKELDGTLLGTNQPQYLLLTLTYVDYWHNPKAYHPERSIRRAFDSLIGKESFSDAQKITHELQKMNRYGLAITPYIIRNKAEIQHFLAKAQNLYKQAVQKNPSLGKWTSYEIYFRIFGATLNRAQKMEASAFQKNLIQLQSDAAKETDFNQETDLLFTPYDFGGGASPLFYAYRCEKRLATYARGKKTGQSNMQVNFTITAQQNKQEYQLILCAQDDDSEKKCPIRIELNGNLLFHGANPFQRFGWNRKTFKIPQGILKEGNNTLSICNIADSGNVSGPPFFMLNYAVLKAQAK